jgi:hypothetical protein
MRIRAIGGILCLVLVAACAPGGDTAKVQPFRELSTEDLDGLDGDWEAVVNTPDGWKGTLRAKVARKRNNPEVSSFHHLMVVTFDLKFTDQKKAKKDATVTGNERIGLIPFQKDKQRYVQCLRDFQVQQKEFLLDLLEYRPSDKKAAAQLAALQPSSRDTAALWIESTTWTLEAAPVVVDFLAKNVPAGRTIDWDSRIVWKKAKSK